MPRIFASSLTTRKNRTTLKARTKTLSIALFLSFLSFASCHKTINDLSAIDWVSAKYKPSQITRGGLAVLPVGESEGSPVESQWIGKELASDLSAVFGKDRIVGPDVVLGYGKDKTLAPLLKILKKKTAPDTVRGIMGLNVVGEKLHVRYLLQTDIRLAEVAGGAEHIRIFGRIWDTRSDEIIWSGYGEARGYVYGFFPAVPASFEKDGARAVSGLVKEIRKPS